MHPRTTATMAGIGDFLKRVASSTAPRRVQGVRNAQRTPFGPARTPGEAAREGSKSVRFLPFGEWSLSAHLGPTQAVNRVMRPAADRTSSAVRRDDKLRLCSFGLFSFSAPRPMPPKLRAPATRVRAITPTMRPRPHVRRASCAPPTKPRQRRQRLPCQLGHNRLRPFELRRRVRDRQASHWPACFAVSATARALLRKCR